MDGKDRTGRACKNVNSNIRELGPICLTSHAISDSFYRQPTLVPHYRTGFLTMEQTRKLVLMSESDPKAFELPLVGLWVAGTEDLQEPYIWAACARYSGLQPETARTVRTADGSDAFLLLVYLKGASCTPRVYECIPRVKSPVACSVCLVR